VDITIVFKDGKWTVHPDPATVKVGTPITWLVRMRSSLVPLLRWIVYFDHGSPFKFNRLRVATRNTELGTALIRDGGARDALKNAGVSTDEIADHDGVIGPISPEEPGDYKYGVRLENAETGERMGDDDPRLIVRGQ
jgi:hypothetical protein